MIRDDIRHDGDDAIADLPTASEVLARQLEDPELRRLWEANAVARAVAARVLAYRIERGLTQTAFGRLVGMKQPQAARLEDGEHAPTWGTLIRLARLGGMGIRIEISPSRSGALPNGEKNGDTARGPKPDRALLGFHHGPRGQAIVEPESVAVEEYAAPDGLRVRVALT